MVRIDTEGYREGLKFALWGDKFGIEKDRVLGMPSDGWER